MEKKPVLHLMVNNKCSNDCPLCCNKQYDIKDVPVVTEQDLLSIDEICFTGGQPLRNIDAFYSLYNGVRDYPNIKRIFIYANGSEFLGFCAGDFYRLHRALLDKDIQTGLTLSPKSEDDWDGMRIIRWYLIDNWPSASNFLYCFNDKDIEKAQEIMGFTNVIIRKREWQSDFKPAPNTFFRRLPIWLE